jgi:hypothetical protein
LIEWNPSDRGGRAGGVAAAQRFVSITGLRILVPIWGGTMQVDSMTDKERRWLDALHEFRAVLDEVDFPFFIDTGTLLGAVRDKRFIPWDNDIDFGTIKSENTHKKLAEASRILHAAGYSYFRSDQATYFVKSPDIEFGIMFYEKDGDFYVNEFRRLTYRYGLLSHFAYLVKAVKSGFIVDYHGHNFAKKARHLLMKLVGHRPFRPEKQFSRLFDLEIKPIRIPGKFFDNLKAIDLYGTEYPAPNPSEEYLTWRYGNWKIPVSNYDYFVEDRSIVAEELSER